MRARPVAIALGSNVGDREAHLAAGRDELAARGVSWLLAEGGIPRRMRAAYLDDDQVRKLADHAAHLRADAREAA